MPTKRSSNTKQAAKTKVAPKAKAMKAGAKAAKKQPTFEERFYEGVETSLAEEITGIALFIIAIVLFFCLCLPQVGLVTTALASFFDYLFGSAAILLPVSLILIAVAFVLPGRALLSSRSLGGVALAFFSLLTLVSVIQDALATGVVGDYLGSAMILLFGEAVAEIILVGFLVVALVLCGFSISACIERLRELHLIHVEEREEEKALQSAYGSDDLLSRKLWDHAPKPPKGGGATSYIGERKKSVLKREPRDLAPKEHPLLETEQENNAAYATPETLAETTLLSDGAAEVAPPLADLAETTLMPEDVNKKRPRKGTKRTGNEANAEKAAPHTLESKDSRPGLQTGELDLPSLSILASNPKSASASSSEEELKKTANRLQATLEEFGLNSRVRGWVAGPLVTTFKIEMGEGERVNKITNLEDDIALSLAASSVRIFAPIPGTSLVGIEIPNHKRNNVFLGDVLPTAGTEPLEIAVGRNSEGTPMVINLASLPHLLVAGTTGSGKSVMLNAAIMSILMRATPEQVRFILVDPKRVEFTGYAGLPHLYVPVVNEPQQAASALQWSVAEMTRRLKVFEKAGARDIKQYNKMIQDGKLTNEEGKTPEKIPCFVIVIDELADLMMVAGKDVEASIVRIAQLGRAAGIHLIVATQRPSADVVTGLIKANIDNRVALSVDNGMNSRIIIDQNGAEKLLGNGDMLVKLRGEKPVRVQGCYVSDPEIKTAINFIKSQVEVEYHNEILSLTTPITPGGYPGAAAGSDSPDAPDPLLWQAAHLVVDSQLGSTSGLQRRLKVGYARAGRIMDMLEERGIVGPASGSKPRDVLVDEEQLIEIESQETLQIEEGY